MLIIGEGELREDDVGGGGIVEMGKVLEGLRKGIGETVDHEVCGCGDGVEDADMGGKCSGGRGDGRSGEG